MATTDRELLLVLAEAVERIARHVEYNDTAELVSRTTADLLVEQSVELRQDQYIIEIARKQRGI